MRAASRAGAALAAGVATFGITRGMQEFIYLPAEEVNEKAGLCAAQLGTTAMRTSVLAKECQDYEDRFSYKETIIYAYDPKAQVRQEIRVNRTYSLPSAADFKEEHIITPSEEKAEDTEADQASLALGGFMFVMGFGWLSLANKLQAVPRPRQSEEGRV